MVFKIPVAVAAILLLAGCVTTSTTPKNQTPQFQSQIKELQDKVNIIERELQSKARKISKIEMELEKIIKEEEAAKQKIGALPTTILSVRQIQTALKNAGFYEGAIDGKLGPQTRAAIKEFQKTHGLKVDGIVGKHTTTELNQYLE